MPPFLRLILVLVMAVWALGLADLARAASSEPFESEQVTARLISAEDGVAPNASAISAGFDVALKPGWKTYWHTPGEVGLPPQLDWSASENVDDVELMYPRPKRFHAFGVDQIGYETEVVYPLRVRLADTGKPAVLKASATILVCKEICIPEVFELSLPLATGSGIDRMMATRIATFAATVPADGEEAVIDEATVGGASLFGFLGLAFLGGLILNLMPCVLPVLAIKLGSAIAARDESRTRIRRGFLVSAAGVMAFVLGLAGVLVALKASGALVGWGMQFQSATFLTFVVAILALFAASMFGVFEIALPGAVNNRMAGAGTGYAGDFATGAFAALLATPCSAPFLGTAVAFALAGGPLETFAIFAALGLGLALPYLAVAAFPGLVRALPRPGPWMEWLKRILGLALAATALWLLWVLAGVSGAVVAALIAALILAAMALIALPVGAFGRWRGVAALALILAAFIVPLLIAPPTAEADDSDHIWTAFRASPLTPQIAEHVKAGRTVFVDVTADWCLTCKVNKAAVLSTDAIEKALEGATALRADWTRPNDQILTYLKTNKRAGIPFNAVYGPGAPDGIMLGELLTKDAVLDALKAARGG